jgi:hypothetical protein
LYLANVQIKASAQQAQMLRRLAASRASGLLRQQAAEQLRCGSCGFGLVYADLRDQSIADVASAGAARSASYSSTAWQTSAGLAFARVAGDHGGAAARDYVPSAATSALLHAAQPAGVAHHSVRGISPSTALLTARQLSSFPGPPPNVQHRPQHATKAEDAAPISGELGDDGGHENGAERQSAAQMLSQQLEDIHGPPAPPADAVDLQSPGTQSATSMAEAAALLQVLARCRQRGQAPISRCMFASACCMGHRSGIWP